MRKTNGVNVTYTKILTNLASLALFVTALNVNTACWYIMGQEELPNGAEKLRKFK